MSTRFQEAPPWVNKLVETVQRNHFPELADASFFVVMDTQKRESGGHILPGSISKASAEIRFLKEDDDLDYKIRLDDKVFKNLNDAQQLFLIHWLLCHCVVVTEDEVPTFKRRSPDFPMFAAQFDFDAHWRQTWDDISAVAAQAHAGKTGPATNDKNFPHMFTGQDGKPLVKCPYPETKAEACGPCEDADNCGACCYGCVNQDAGREPDMAPGCEILHRDAADKPQEAA